MSSDNLLFYAFHLQELPGESGPYENAIFTSVIDKEFSDLCLNKGVLFLLTVLPPRSHQLRLPIASVSVHFPACEMRILA
jgi:hypothetical protein